MRHLFFRAAASAAAALCLAAGAARAQALLIDDFSAGFTTWSWPATPLPASGVFDARVAAGVPGGTRYVAMQPAPASEPDPYGHLITGPGLGAHVYRRGIPSLTVTLGYGLDAPLDLDLSGQDALRFDVNFASTIEHGTGYFGDDPLSVTVYATTSRGTGLNPDGSAAEFTLAPRGVSELPFSRFFVNASTGVGVNWADVDSLLFVINDSQRSAWAATWELASISAVPEPAGWALWGAGGLALTVLKALKGLRRRRAAVAAALAFSGSAALADGTILNIQGFGDSGAGTLSPLIYPLPAGTVIDLDKPLLVPLEAGSYSLVDAWGLPGALYDTWNFQRDEPGSWLSHYVAALARPDGRYSVLVDGLSLQEPGCVNHFCAWSTQAQAAAAFAATPAYDFTLDSAGTVAFVSADYFLPDNLGGISLLLSAVPEASPGAMWLAGLAALGWLQRCRRGAR